MIKNWFKKVTGIERLEREHAEALARTAEAKVQEQLAIEAEAVAKMTPKERATKRKEPWVAVLDTHVNKDNIRNGFFELDWNEYFITQLKQTGYGEDGDKEEEIIDRWFRDLARNMIAEEGMDPRQFYNAGYINVTKLPDGKAQVE